MARIGIFKIGRSYNLNAEKATSVGGDIDVLNLIHRLAVAFPNDKIVLAGKNSGENPIDLGYPANVENPWTEWRKLWNPVTDPTRADEMITRMREVYGNTHENIDAIVVWAGQHGSANSRIPMIGSSWIVPPGVDDTGDNSNNDIITGGTAEALATPQFSFIAYVSHVLDFISRWQEHKGPLRHEPVWLCPDPRNYLKCREKRWPIRYPVLAQYNMLKYHKGERYGRFSDELAELDPTGYRENSLWVSNVAYCQSGLELTAVPDPSKIQFDPRPGPKRFGMLVNENLQGVKDSRLALLKSWVLPHFPEAEIRGHWTEKSQMELNRIFNPVPYSEVMAVMKSFATTLTTPASGSGWATAKPWEAFAVGSLCFFHPRYDDQGQILPYSIDDAHDEDQRVLVKYLRVNSPEELAERVALVHEQPELYFTLATAQRRFYEKSFRRWQGGARSIIDRLHQELGEDHPNELWTTRTEPIAAKVASRVEARPRGTNEERRKKKPPVSRRRAAREEMMTRPDEQLVDVADVVADEIEEQVVEASTGEQTVEQNVAYMGPTKFEPMVVKTTAVQGALPDKAQLRAALEAMGLAVPDELKEPVRAPRPSRDETFLKIAEDFAERSTCSRRSVGCVLVNKYGIVVSMGHNGVWRGANHCNETHPCTGAGLPSGQGLDQCFSIHAEQNALMWCPDVDQIETCYVTTSACSSQCIKMLLNTSCRRIVFRDKYVDHEVSEKLWTAAGREWIHLPSTI